VILHVGDGGFTMLLGEFMTSVEHKLPLKIVVYDNSGWGLVHLEMEAAGLRAARGTGFPNVDFAAFARACGATGFSVADPKQCGGVLEQAFATPGPVVVEAVVDPFEPPMPPKITVEQAAHFAEALAKGTPNRKKIALTVVADKVRELV
jgi:pyruvate dehydrogenase (quinone)/pyruvate oxidase